MFWVITALLENCFRVWLINLHYWRTFLVLFGCGKHCNLKLFSCLTDYNYTSGEKCLKSLVKASQLETVFMFSGLQIFGCLSISTRNNHHMATQMEKNYHVWAIWIVKRIHKGTWESQMSDESYTSGNYFGAFQLKVAQLEKIYQFWKIQMWTLVRIGLVEV